MQLFSEPMKTLVKSALSGILMMTSMNMAAQGIHFSQYYNAPMLTSPANAGLMSDKDFRIGANYRSQWGAIPVPFNTFSVQADLQVFPSKDHSNWMGLGFAAFSDKAGEGNLAYSRYEGFMAYHIQLGEYQMLSVGASIAAVQRSIDFSQLSFDAQWDGSDYNLTLSNNEKGLVAKTHYTDISAGINYAIFPSELLYMKVSAALAHVNEPVESFQKDNNVVGTRPTINVDVLVRTGHESILTLNPSVLYTSEKGAMELMYGGLILVDPGKEAIHNRVMTGIFNRYKDALVFAAGYEWNGLRILASYDYTISRLAQYIHHNGAFEVGLRWMGLYKAPSWQRRSYICPRF